jgi:hypothetical protein
LSLEKTKIYSVITLVSIIIGIGTGAQQAIAYFQDNYESDIKKLSQRIDDSRIFLDKCNFSEEGHSSVESMLDKAEKEIKLNEINEIDIEQVRSLLNKAKFHIQDCTEPCENCTLSMKIEPPYPILFVIVAIISGVLWRKSKKKTA